MELHSWLENFTVYSVDPKCHSPPRVIGEKINGLAEQEFACIPEVSPTTMYLEVIEGKNMSLVCTIKVRYLIHSIQIKLLVSSSLSLVQGPL